MVRPIDVQQIVLQSNPVEKIQQVQQRFPDMQQQYIENQSKVNKRTEKEQIQQTRKPEQLKVMPDDHRRGSQEGNPEHPGRGKEHDATDPDSSLRGANVDIRA